MKNANTAILLVWLFLVLATLACVRDQAQVIVITATFMPPTQVVIAPQVTHTPLPQVTAVNPVRQIPDTTLVNAPVSYIVQPGDTLTAIALRNGVGVETLLSLNELINPDALSVGQVLFLPPAPTVSGSDVVLLPNSKLVRAPGSAQFDVDAFINEQSGYIRVATDEINDQTYSASEIVKRVALEFSVDPRLLLALLEFRAGWLTNPQPSETQRDYPMGAPTSQSGVDRRGLYRQLTWAADNLNYGYYGWQRGGISTLEFTDGTRVIVAPELNEATIGLQYLLSRMTTYPEWAEQVSVDGFIQTYRRLFGDPFENALATLVPAGLEQPSLRLPFSPGETWYYTGGPHGGWGSGSAWAAIDFAPPDDITLVDSSCYLSGYYATAVAPGVIARVDEGTVILDLDGDGDESTGWTILYLHIASEGRIEEGVSVSAGDRIGHPSCEGGFSNGTHMHFARRYNGEWIPADCDTCDETPRPPLNLGGWQTEGISGQEYQGYLVNGSDRLVAEQMREVAPNEISG
jgi:LysM repeat protein